MVKANVSDRKKKMFKELVELLLKNDTVIVSSVKGIPSPQFQKIRKKLYGQVIIKAVKKNVMALALEKATETKPEIKELEKYIEDNCVILFSDTDPFELASMLAENKTPAKAKAGQIAKEDIHLTAGVTDFPAGPLISELSSAGLKIAIEGGKIAIKEDKILVKKGEKINDVSAGILAKLEITPFSIGLNTIAIYSGKEKKVFTGIKVDKEEAEHSLKEAISSSLNFSLNIKYPCKETISFLLARANAEFNALNSILNLNV